MARGNKRVVAPVDVESETLCTFSENHRLFILYVKFLIEVYKIWFKLRDIFGARPRAAVFVTVCGADSALRSTDFFVFAVFFFMSGSRNVCVCGNKDLSFRFYAAFFQLFYLVKKHLWIERTAGADDRF